MTKICRMFLFRCIGWFPFKLQDLLSAVLTLKWPRYLWYLKGNHFSSGNWWWKLHYALFIHKKKRIKGKNHNPTKKNTVSKWWSNYRVLCWVILISAKIWKKKSKGIFQQKEFKLDELIKTKLFKSFNWTSNFNKQNNQYPIFRYRWVRTQSLS